MDLSRESGSKSFQMGYAGSVTTDKSPGKQERRMLRGKDIGFLSPTRRSEERIQKDQERIESDNQCPEVR